MSHQPDGAEIAQIHAVAVEHEVADSLADAHDGLLYVGLLDAGRLCYTSHDEVAANGGITFGAGHQPLLAEHVLNITFEIDLSHNETFF